MIHEYYKELQNNQNIRENLSLLRSECKDPQAREPCCLWWETGHCSQDCWRAMSRRCAKMRRFCLEVSGF